MNANITKLIIAILSLILSIAFAYLALAYAQLPFNPQGRYIDTASGIVLHEQGVIIIILVSLAFFLAGLFGLSRYWRRR